eukprot:Opistho-2@88864
MRFGLLFVAAALLLAEVVRADITCPDDESSCPDGYTCCLLAGGAYGCCPLPDATCCSDNVHCCPSGTTCNVAAGSCDSAEQPGLRLPLSRKQPAMKLVGNTACADGKSACADGYTCCLLASGDYGCCPHANATCCDDHVHCCPGGYTCDVAAGACTLGSKSTIALTKVPAINSESVPCPDGKSACADGQTCCVLEDGAYGCCAQADATCCDDHVHCCPSGYDCDLGIGICVRKAHIVDVVAVPAVVLEKASSKKNAVVAANVKSVVCSDTRYACDDGTTCCMQPSGEYSCCPLANAVCCSDHVHCCPVGYYCDLSAGTCRSTFDVVAFVKKTSAKVY